MAAGPGPHTLGRGRSEEVFLETEDFSGAASEALRDEGPWTSA